MKPSDLHALWAAPDNSRLTSKQYSFRLPVHVAAKLTALCELYPSKTRTQIVGDLLAMSIDASVSGLPSARGRHVDRVSLEDGTELNIYEEAGPLGRFKELANKHYGELERELGNDEPSLLYPYEYTSGNPDRPENAFTVEEQRR